MKTKQYIVIGSVVVLMGILLSLDIKGLVKKEDASGAEAETAATAEKKVVSGFSRESVLAIAKQNVSPSLLTDIEKVENSLKKASGDEEVSLQEQLAKKWDDVNQPAASAFAYEAIAEKKPTYQNWMKAGDRFTEGYQNFPDTTSVQGLTEKAIHAYNKALELNAESLDAQTGLGIAYVTGTNNPMQGIQLLLKVVEKDPENLKANMSLGLFSMKSGQFGKAVDRFKTVVKVKKDPEAYFYMATSYENMGMKTAAVEAYEEAKRLAGDPGLSSFIDRKIKELNN
ncbi:Tetratricopeptide TPR_1 repeat-containing protein [Pseudopedobacter saltans DSM 12145]|uniref:Tetratricopeptide TPR_1 repeat-containing protein n=1 Tax=Pseudopedobacter saltans (strain ATCC 51119 / DSM 12145 / JCM 21818 / CCUG 39354 / LMG 10337 / NBRC 100064 / NCIMB 13643) TaxID=762903 RepID=F0SAP7_PSESL|nr:tetratricopeptide repeat protein [Pseudopedobacter saltans]ADY53668.1 Tetratricopeptide TPR_1 repeat-containing protein [Pseudopedobacter saltans DSM 12145]